MAPKEVISVSPSRRCIEGGGFVVRRPDLDPRDMSPFLMLDHFGPTCYGPGEAVGAPDHPHRGFETISYILQGCVEHKDSNSGTEGRIGPGDVQWMTAGRGVIHSEMPSPEMLENGGTMEGFQIWVNLPASVKMCEPRYQDISSACIPETPLQQGAGHVRIIAGTHRNRHAVIETHTAVHFYDVVLESNDAIDVISIPEGQRAFVYCYSQGLMVNGKEVLEGRFACLSSTADQVIISALSSTSSGAALVLGGVPFHEPLAWHGPFVMNTQAEIREAMRDYQRGDFGKIEGAEQRYEQTRQANVRREGSDSSDSLR